MTQQQQNADYLIRQAVYAKTFPTRHGEMNRFDLIVEDAAGQQYECELVQKPTTAPPAENEIIRGHLETTQHGLKFRKEYGQQAQQAPAQPAQPAGPMPQPQVAPGSLTGAPMPPAPAPAPVPAAPAGPSPEFQAAQAAATQKHEDSEAGRVRRWAISVAREYLSDQTKQGSIPGYTLNDLERQAEQFVRMANGEAARDEAPPQLAPADDEAPVAA